MILFPPCKVNIGLRVLRKRGDGYHDLESIFFPVGVRDALEVLPSETFTLSISGLDIPGDPASNLCRKAYDLLKKDFPDLPPVQVYLHKHIPAGGGLGGGSADGAYMLRLLDRRFRLGLPPGTLARYAATLGSDCSFFLHDGPCLARGRGEILTPVDLKLEGYAMVLVHPGIHVNTAWAFGQVLPDASAEGALAACAREGFPPLSRWRDIFVNDFEPAVLREYAAVRDVKESLYAAGAEYASMTGSGSAVYGLFDPARVPDLSFPRGYWKQICIL